MATNGPKSNLDTTPPFKKTPIAEALFRVFGEECDKVMRAPDFKTLNPGVEGVMSHAVQGYYSIGIQSNRAACKEAANDTFYGDDRMSA